MTINFVVLRNMIEFISLHLDVENKKIRVFLMNQLLLKKEPGIFAIQNTISTMLRMLIPVNKPSVPPRIKENVRLLKIRLQGVLG